eukprot:2790304-Pleurochrysis_carterae.AAC.2
MGDRATVVSLRSATAVAVLIVLVITSWQRLKQQFQGYMKRAGGLCLWLLSPASLPAVHVKRNLHARIGMSTSGDGENARQWFGHAPKAYTSTVALVPPEDAWPPLQVHAFCHTGMLTLPEACFRMWRLTAPKSLSWPQAMRASLHDKGLYRWPPHINLLYPFLQHSFAECALNEFAPVLAQLSPFQITLDSLGIFGG